MELDKSISISQVVYFLLSKDEKTITSMDLQLKFKWGYNRANSVIKKLQELQIISEYQYPKGSNILIDKCDCKKKQWCSTCYVYKRPL
jgi:DNA segregation ATPase FtsK/SpoIIIE-like protein